MVWVGTRYSTPPGPTRYPYPGYTLPTEHAAVLMAAVPHCPSPVLNSVVGLRSVDQLTLSPEISGFEGITEVYNLLYAGNPNDHFSIPGID